VIYYKEIKPTFLELEMNIQSVVCAICVVLLSNVLGGCATHPSTGSIYTLPSPTVQVVKESDYKMTTRRPVNSILNQPETTLGATVRQAGDVMITITFSYTPPRSSKYEARTGNCQIHIKSPDSSLADVLRCRIQPAGNTFIVSFRSRGGEKSFDLLSLNGRYDGAWPIAHRGRNYSYGFYGGAERTLRYYYVGPDPFK